MMRTRPIFRAIWIAVLLTLLSGAAWAGGSSSSNCFSVLVGREASQSGAVLFAHNEDDWGQQLVNWYYVPRQTHATGETIVLKQGAKLEQVPESWAYHW